MNRMRLPSVVLSVLLLLMAGAPAGSVMAHTTRLVLDPMPQAGIVRLVAAVRPSIALVNAGVVHGTAFAVGRGLLVTALHVVAKASWVSLRMANGSVVFADVVGVDTDRDVAVLRVSVEALHTQGVSMPPLPLADRVVRDGEDIVVIGYPLPSSPYVGVSDLTVTRGIVSAIRAQSGMIQVDAAMNPGVSGGPVLTLDGKVVGVADSSLVGGGVQNVNFAVPSTAAQAVLYQVLLDGRPLLLPLVSTRTVTLSYSSPLLDSPDGSVISREQHGAQCADSPPGAIGLNSFSAHLLPMSLSVVVWWTLCRGASSHSPAVIARMSDLLETSYEVADLGLPPERVCLNYFAVTNTQGSFDVLYTLDYEVYRIQPRH